MARSVSIGVRHIYKQCRQSTLLLLQTLFAYGTLVIGRIIQLQALRKQADALNVNWNVVLMADGAAPTSADWGRLMRLVHKALPQVKQALLDAAAPVLLVNSGLIARYGLMPLIDDLRDEVGRPGTLSSLWMLLPMAANGLPTIDDVPVPVLTSTQWASVPVAWAKNLHRAAA